MRNYEKNPPWEDIKQWAFESGFLDDGFGDPTCSSWDSLRLFANRVYKDALSQPEVFFELNNDFSLEENDAERD